MPPKTAKIVPGRYEEFFPLEDYFGLNTFGPHQTHKPGECLTLENCDIFSGYLRDRPGSDHLNGLTLKFPDREVLSHAIWDTGADEYILAQIRDAAGTGCEFWTCRLAASSTPTQIAGLTLATTAQADMSISNDRCMVFTPVGNRIIEFAAGTFTGRSMGLPQAFLAAVTSPGSGALTGKYTYGVELVYQVSSVDRLASSPSRQIVTTRIINSITVAAGRVRVAVDSVVPAANTLWTHARLYRSKNQNIDYSDPANPVDAQGVPEELYSLQTMTRADFIAAGYTFADDQVLDKNIPATAFYVEIDKIDLEPLPAAHLGIQHRGRIFVSRMQGVDDTSQANIGYSLHAGTKYSEQWDPDQVVRAEPGDGQQTIKLLGFERDLIVIKEAKTGRVLDGNPDNGFETLDHRIGISHKRMAAYIPGVGIAAITNDQGDFRLFGYDLRWTNQWGERDISRYIRTQTAALTPAQVSFAYINGKLLIADGTGVFYVLHVEQGKGWTKYSYPMNGRAEALATFAAGSRCLVLSRNTYLLEIEKAGTTTDRNTATDVQDMIVGRFTTHRFQKRNGRDVLEMRHLSVNGSLSASMAGIPYGNGLPWPGGAVAVSTNFVVDQGVAALYPPLKEREYRLYLEDKLICNFLHFVISTLAPFTIHDIQLLAMVIEMGGSHGAFDPYGVAQFAVTAPDWSLPAPAADLIDGGYENETVQDFLDGGYESEAVADFVDGGYPA